MGVVGRILNAPGVREARLFASLPFTGPPVRNSAPTMFVRAARALWRLPPEPRRHRMLLVAGGTIWLRQALALAPIFAARGSAVDIVVIPYGGASLTDPPLIDDFYRLRALRRALRTPHVRLLFTAELARAELDDGALDRVRAQSELDAKVLAASGNATGNAYEARLRLNTEAAAAVDGMLARNRYDSALVANGASLELGAVFRLLGLRGVRRVAWEFAEPRGRAVVTLDSTIEHMPTEPYWEADAPHVLDEARRRRVAQFVAERETTDWRSLMQTYQVAPARPPDETRAQLGLPESGPVALLCSNLVWEAYYITDLVPQEGLAYPTMDDWVVDTIRFFSERPDWELVVRAHPWERRRADLPGLEDVVRRAFPDLPLNVHFAAPTDPVSTYSLMAVADLGLAYLSTTGLEMAVRGLPVVTAGRPHYAGKGFTIDPRSPDDYRRSLDEILADPAGRRPTPRQVELAWCYLDVSVYGFTHPFPWVPLHFDADLDEWPVERCLSREGEERFGGTFDLLRGIGWSERRLPEGWRPTGVEPAATPALAEA